MLATARLLGVVVLAVVLSFAATYTTPGTRPQTASRLAAARAEQSSGSRGQETMTTDGDSAGPCGQAAWWDDIPGGGISVAVEEPLDATAVVVETSDGEDTRQSGGRESGESLRHFGFPYMSGADVQRVVVRTADGACTAAPAT